MKVKKIWVKEKLLIPQPQASSDKDAKRKLKQLRREILDLLTKERFVSFFGLPHAFYDNRLQCLWLFYGFKAQPSEMHQNLQRIRLHAFRNWELPTPQEAATLAGDGFVNKLPRMTGSLLYTNTPAAPEGYFRTISLENGRMGSNNTIQTIAPLHRTGHHDILSFILAHALRPLELPVVEEKLKQLYLFTVQLNKQPDTVLPPSLHAIQQHLLSADYLRVRLPVLEPAYLFDMKKGLWELYHRAPPKEAGWVEVPLKEPWEARNPEEDVRNGVVAIDFGTSSTVVACRERGKTTLLRVGMSDFFKKPAPEDYQNPTVLEFINLPNLLAAWQGEAYRPMTRWEDVRFAHDALAHLKEHQTDQRIVASLLANLKQWPLHAFRKQPLRLTDQATDMELSVMPVKTPETATGQPITVSDADPFNPIELYAYFLGLFINHRESGLFLEYYMTFPVTYPREVKERIRTAFARGLQRSLPPSIVDSPKFSRFKVREEASEPSAYAACALQELGIEATREGTAFAVFDFGGGTTDFDFGVYRTPKVQEEQEGYDGVIQHFAASGDTYLGGENLIANLAYLAFQQNLEICREHHIPFLCPPDAEPFAGHELFLDNSHVAQINNSLMMAQVRPFWEDFLWQVPEDVVAEEKPGKKARPEREAKRPRRQTDFIGDALRAAIVDADFTVDPACESCPPAEKMHKCTLSLLDRDRKKVEVTFTIDRNRLNHYLVQRMGKGVHQFLVAMRQAFAEGRSEPEQVHVLLAGNASRSLLVQSLFAALLQDRMAGWSPPDAQGTPSPMDEVVSQIPFPRFVVHRPPTGDPDNPYKPTAKTGVAIGLLKLIPGETLLALGPTSREKKAEAPFLFFVGRFRKGVFQPVLQQNGPYNTWKELGRPTRGVFVLAYSQLPIAGVNALSRGASELHEWSIHLTVPAGNKTLFVQAASPDSVEVCLADSVEQIEKRPEEIAHAETIFLT